MAFESTWPGLLIASLFTAHKYLSYALKGTFCDVFSSFSPTRSSSTKLVVNTWHLGHNLTHLPHSPLHLHTEWFWGATHTHTYWCSNQCWTSGAGHSLYICFFVARCDRIADDEDDEDQDNDRIDVIAWLTARPKWPIGCQGALRRAHNVCTCAYVEEGRILWRRATNHRIFPHTRGHTGV